MQEACKRVVKRACGPAAKVAMGGAKDDGANRKGGAWSNRLIPAYGTPYGTALPKVR